MSNIYQDTVDVHIESIMAGEREEQKSLAELATSDIGLLRAFANDNEIQYMKIISTNIGMIREYTKQYAK